MGRKPNPTICIHTDREAYARGICKECAGAELARTPTCGHPGRKHYGKNMCGPCYMTKWNRDHPEANAGSVWRKRNPEAARRYKRLFTLRKYGLTIEDYESLWEGQGGKCANARCSFRAEVSVPDHRFGLQVDHCHDGGQVRGLLCPGCNLALGCVRDDIGRLRGLIDYLER